MPFPQPEESGPPRSHAAWWRHLFEEAEDAQAVCDVEGSILEINRKGQQLLNLDQHAALLSCPLFDPVTVTELKRALGRDTEHSETLSSVGLRCGKEVVFVGDIQVTPLDADCSLVAFKDVSRRWRIETHAQRLLAAIHATPEVVWLADQHFSISFVNPAFPTATGYSIEDAFGRTPDFLRAPAQGDIIRQYTARVRSGGDWVGELINRRSDGSTYPVEVTISPIHDRNGEFLGCAAFERDITAQRQLQNELLLERNLVRSIINSLDASLYTLDGRLRITHFNDGWKKMPVEHGWLNLKEPPETGRCLLDYVPDPVHRAELEKLCRSVLAEGRPQEIGTVGEAGHHWMIHIVPWRHEGQIRGLIYKVTDNASLVGIQNQLYQAQKMHTLGSLTAGVAHDFNNLLLAIRGNAGLVLLDDALEPTIRNRLQQVDQAAARAGDLAQQLLSFSRVSEEKIAVLDFNQMIREASDLAKRTLRGRVSIHLRPSNEPLKVQMDATRAQQLLLNLCINAADAMPDRGEIVITNERVVLNAAQAAKARRAVCSDYMCCRVADNGAGIPPEVLPRIFSPFFTTKPKGKGTGLGLAIVHDVVTAAGGFIEVESGLGKGTTFRIYLPLDCGPISLTTAPARPDIQKGSGRLLVVDDLDLVLEFASNFLSQAGYEVLTATSADAALAVLEKQTVPLDLVLTDYAMPGRDGLQLIQEAAVRWPKLKFMIASGYLDDEARARIVQMSGIQVLTKPYSIAQATQLIAEVLGNARP